MNIDPGLVIVIAAVLIFYLRLIILQRESAKRLRRSSQQQGAKKGKSPSPTSPPYIGILSSSRRDLVIGGIGTLVILFGLLLYAGTLPLAAIKPYWWIPSVLGIIAFSFAFRLR